MLLIFSSQVLLIVVRCHVGMNQLLSGLCIILLLKLLLMLCALQQVSVNECLVMLEMRLASQESDNQCHIHSTKDIEQMSVLSSNKQMTNRSSNHS